MVLHRPIECTRLIGKVKIHLYGLRVNQALGIERVESNTCRDIMLSMTSPLFVLSAVFLICTGHCQAQTDKNSAESRNSVTTLTGILLVSDRRCDEWPADVPKDTRTC